MSQNPLGKDTTSASTLPPQKASNYSAGMSQESIQKEGYGGKKELSNEQRESDKSAVKGGGTQQQQQTIQQKGQPWTFIKYQPAASQSQQHEQRQQQDQHQNLPQHQQHQRSQDQQKGSNEIPQQQQQQQHQQQQQKCAQNKQSTDQWGMFKKERGQVESPNEPDFTNKTFKEGEKVMQNKDDIRPGFLLQQDMSGEKRANLDKTSQLQPSTSGQTNFPPAGAQKTSDFEKRANQTNVQ
eukprot:403348276